MPILLKFATEIKGDSKVDGHDGWISCKSVNFDVKRTVQKNGAGTDRDLGNPACNEITIRKSTDIASPALMLQACCGKSLGKAEIHYVRTGGADSPPEVVASWELTDAIVSTYEQDARDESGNIHPSDTVKLNFTQMKLKYNQFDGGQAVGDDTKGFDIMKNKAL